MKYYLIVGEASGDLHASHLMTAIRKIDTNTQFRFFGGDMMKKVGGELARHYKDTAIMGFIPVITHFRKILQNISLCKQDLLSYNPDRIILVDYPGFNLQIAAYAKKKLPNTPIIYYISPKIWAWKEGRIHQIKKNIDLLISILPFEVNFYNKHNYPIHYVGNPSYSEVMEYLEHPTPSNIIEQCKSKYKHPIIAILPGSRQQEIKDNLPYMIEAAAKLTSHQIIVSKAPNIDISLFNTILKGYNYNLLQGETFELLRQADLAIVVSGTATLECALFRTPQAICYRVKGGKIIYKLYRKFIKTKFVTLPNLIANQEICREILGHHVTTYNIFNEIVTISQNDNYRLSIQKGYQTMFDNIGNSDAPTQAAKLILEKSK